MTPSSGNFLKDGVLFLCFSNSGQMFSGRCLIFPLMFRKHNIYFVQCCSEKNSRLHQVCLRCSFILSFPRIYSRLCVAEIFTTQEKEIRKKTKKMKNIIVMDFSNTILVAQEKNMNNCKSFRIKEELKKEILNTGCRNGEKISSVRVLASRFSISTATARKILQNLVKEKILVPHKGVGYFIGENKVPGILIIWNSAVPDAKNHPTGTLTLRYITEYLEKNNFKYEHFKNIVVDYCKRYGIK